MGNAAYVSLCLVSRENRWKKRGIALTPTKFGIAFTATFMNQVGSRFKPLRMPFEPQGEKTISGVGPQNVLVLSELFGTSPRFRETLRSFSTFMTTWEHNLIFHSEMDVLSKNNFIIEVLCPAENLLDECSGIPSMTITSAQIA